MLIFSPLLSSSSIQSLKAVHGANLECEVLIEQLCCYLSYLNLMERCYVREAGEEENRPEAKQQVEEDAIEAEEEARLDAQAEEDEARPDGQAEEEARSDEEARTDARTEAVEPDAERHEDDACTEASILAPGPPFALLRGIKGSTSATYSVVYQYTDALWQNWRDHMLHEDKRAPAACGRRDGHNTESAEERTATALVLLDSCLSGTHISPFEMKNSLPEVQRILRGQDAAHPSTPAQPEQAAATVAMQQQHPLQTAIIDTI
ncbi:hypothetical protein RHSIM_Rhsim02G0150600 [Rhododendron simsii]|uniref:Uncharacterized protein n=1 Tax=Rhododendron simsii TaxID=118357 RepID=A0A834HGG5_RHOSS|nr:hypothetical protein RHSIM_Rhsim02G0150600 [Rhododendron simsii]